MTRMVVDGLMGGGMDRLFPDSGGEGWDGGGK